MTPELSHEDLSRVGCQHSWQEKQWFSPPECHRSSVPGSLPNTPQQLEKQPSAELPKPTKIPQELLFFIQSDPALWISSRTCSARQSVTRAETHRGLAPNFSLQTLLLWAPLGSQTISLYSLGVFHWILTHTSRLTAPRGIPAWCLWDAQEQLLGVMFHGIISINTVLPSLVKYGHQPSQQTYFFWVLHWNITPTL